MNNIVLIGMPGCGKSTIGVVLAKKMGYAFLDSDLLIQEKEHMLLPEIIKNFGTARFNQIENEVNYSIKCERTVIATGGSVIYGREAMMHLRSIGHMIYLRRSYPDIVRRVGSLRDRGVSMNPGETLSDLYEKRTPLYEKYAEMIVNCKNMSIAEIVEIISAQFVKV